MKRSQKILLMYEKQDKEETQLEKGVKVEVEHKETLITLLNQANPKLTEKELEDLLTKGYELIAQDHIKEIENYYDLLAQLEAKHVNKNNPKA